MKFVVYQDIDEDTIWVTTEEEEAEMLKKYEAKMNLTRFRRIQIESLCVCIDGPPSAINYTIS